MPVIKWSDLFQNVELIPQLALSAVFFMRTKKLASIFHYRLRQPNLNLKIIFMSGLLYLLAVILLIGWLLGVFVYSVGGFIHILIVLAVISLILGIIRRA